MIHPKANNSYIEIPTFSPGLQIWTLKISYDQISNFVYSIQAFGHVRPAKIQISLYIPAVRSEFSLSAFEQPKMKSFFMWTKKTDQTAPMCRLI